MTSTPGSAVLTLPSDTQIMITREFAAPPELVYRVWTDPALIARWWAGQRGQVTVVESDLRVGGGWRYVLLANGGFEVGFHGEYLEIVENERIVYTEVFEMPDVDEADAPVNTVTFTETSPGRTTLTLLTQTSSRELRDTIVNSGMETGVQEQMDIIQTIADQIAQEMAT